MTTKSSSYLSDYLEEVRPLAQERLKGGGQLSEIERLIDRCQEACEEDEQLCLLLEGERYFYHGDYETALKQYLQAKEVAQFQFFCYRASAYIAADRGQQDQVESLLLKALAMDPEDPYLLSLANGMEVDSSGLTKVEPSLSIANSVPEAAKAMTYGTTASSQPSSKNEAAADLPSSDRDDQLQFAYHHGKNRVAEPSEAKAMNGQKATTERPISTQGAIDQILQLRIEEFQKQKARLLTHYLKNSRSPQRQEEDGLYMLSGWDSTDSALAAAKGVAAPLADGFSLNDLPRASTGLFLRWQGCGIAFNPGHGFLRRLHAAGLYVTDIDAVVITHTDPAAYADVEEIYALNYQLNKISSERRVIHYYLNQKAYLELAPILKPHFKQERDALHCLELFVDSPEVEKVEVSPHVTLRYFPTATQEALAHYGAYGAPQRKMGSPLAIRLDLRRASGDQLVEPLKVGYLSGCSWSPLLGHHMGHCDLLFAGFGQTSNNDYSKLAYNEDSLGYYGSYSLAEEVHPKFLFCCEFNGREGDIRLEVCQKMRQELEQEMRGAAPVVLPADGGMAINLASLKMRCCVSRSEVEPRYIKVVKSAEAFEKLLYIAPGCLLE